MHIQDVVICRSFSAGIKLRKIYRLKHSRLFMNSSGCVIAQ